MLPGWRIVVLLGIGFPLFAIMNSLYLQSLFHFNSYARGIEALIMIVFCLIYIAKDHEEGSWGSVPENWVNAGILLYFSGSISQFTFSNVVSVHAPQYFKMIIWDIHATFVWIMYVLFSVGFGKKRLR